MKILKIGFAVPLVLVGLLVVSSPAMACACCGTFKVVNVASWDVLYIRSGPGVGYRKIGSIPSQSACVIKSGRKRGKWHQVSYAGVTGWVNANYLRFFARP